ncbi:MAG: TetR/AcrR family transcriptional regulator [Pseudomonas sp.]|nr:TetR/AcrR family transcriptional regulator [Pseudomonas sp.]
MSPALSPAPTGKGAATRDLIIDRAYGIACSAGLEGLSIGPLAQAVGMSKSGVFAHFGSREDLQLAVLDAAGARFLEAVLVPSLKARRGLPRLRAIVDAWFDWVRDNDGGCLLIAAAAEYDDRPGALRDRVVQHETRWRSDVARAIGLAIDSGELRADTDAAQFAFEIYAVAIAVNHDAGLYGLDAAVARGRRLFDRLLASYSPTA